ncbi:Permease of the drug/metabolite transporter (DMT) superfamily [Consotaella salsifontis]|uniref:Permease of the drug/metabolite transporter (DMT) superfamily n=2 Tax=Consotaella salsifontis TaxID=1365950 RepID=A0A1T4RRQ7_9HYPH|nr:Permease of the drug/metabolite transporter (DMT) superfamily [Consotaella salsifontis]
MWSLLALLTARSGTVPPLQMNAMTFAVGTAVGLVALAWRRVPLTIFRQKPSVWLLGVGGLFGYHALYFAALRAAPAVEASLINYLWPLLIVLGSAALPGEKLRWYHGLGALLGLAGAILVIAGRGTIDFSPEHALGYAFALGAALFWSSYSLLSRRFGHVPSEVVAGFCLATSILSLFAHWTFEETVWPATSGEWLAILGLGLMPVGGAFYVWDYAVKHGDIQLVGAMAYGAPLLSTLLLIAAGESAMTSAIVIAALLVTAGACLAALPVFRRVLRRAKPAAE